MTKLLTGATGVLALADGTVLQGIGVGATGSALGEVVFNTAMTGYQEILTDPSYMSQILAFTFPHVGNTGVTLEDLEQIGGGEDVVVGVVEPFRRRSVGHRHPRPDRAHPRRRGAARGHRP